MKQITEHCSNPTFHTAHCDYFITRKVSKVNLTNLTLTWWSFVLANAVLLKTLQQLNMIVYFKKYYVPLFYFLRKHLNTVFSIFAAVAQCKIFTNKYLTRKHTYIKIKLSIFLLFLFVMQVAPNKA